jgi:transcriptional regulator with PAS, ATPase and Fis domain
MPEGLASTAVVPQRDLDITAEAFAKQVQKNFIMGVLNKPQWLQTMAQISYEGNLRLIIEGMERQMARVLPECQMTISKSRLDSVKTVHSCWFATVVTETDNLLFPFSEQRNII